MNSTQALGPTSVRPVRCEGAASFSRPHRYVSVGHSQLASWTFGQGPDVVFVHGWPLSAATYRHVVAELQRDFTCHLLDLPGAGLSEVSERSPIELRAHADTLAAYLDALGLERYALFAHDSGGFIARRQAARDARVAGLVLSNTEIPGHTPPLLVLLMLLAKSGLGAPVFRGLLSSPTLRRSALGFGGCFTQTSAIDGEFYELFVRPLLESDPALRGAMALLRSAGPESLADLDQVHAAIRAPVRLIWGRDDPWFPLARARAMLAGFGGGASLHEVPGGKLFVHEDHAPAVAADAATFLRTCFAR